MKQRASRQEIDTLFVLGAGASFGLSSVQTRNADYSRRVTPLDKDFLKCLEEFCPQIGWRRNSTQVVLGHWLDRTPATEHGLEEAIIKRVSQYEFLAKIHSRRTRDKCTNQDYLNHLSHLIACYLSGCRPNRSGMTEELARHIFPNNRKNSLLNRIITFNYDTLIDEVLVDRGFARKTLYFDRISDSREEGITRRATEAFRHPLILKLHGSINWRVDRSHFDQIIDGSINPDNKITVWTEDESLPQPEDDHSPMIIPPIPNKPLTTSSLFRFLWTLAYEYMHEAKHIVIVGYSCPPTDTLARTMFSQFKSQNLESVSIVDPNANALGDYREMFSPRTASRAKWLYYPSISEYVVNEVRT